MGGDYPPQWIDIILLVAQRQGITQTEISEILNMPQGSVSRNCKKLASAYSEREQGMVGLDLLENRTDYVIDSRRHAVYLTKKGKEMVKKMQTFFKKG